MTYEPYADDLAPLRSLLGDFTYKPGWRFELGEATSRGFMSGDMATLRVSYSAPDAYHPDNTVPLQGLFPVPYHLTGMTRDNWARWLHDVVMHVEMHEVDEFFVVAGERPFDPHRRVTIFPV